MEIGTTFVGPAQHARPCLGHQPNEMDGGETQPKGVATTRLPYSSAQPPTGEACLVPSEQKRRKSHQGLCSRNLAPGWGKPLQPQGRKSVCVSPRFAPWGPPASHVTWLGIPAKGRRSSQSGRAAVTTSDLNFPAPAAQRRVAIFHPQTASGLRLCVPHSLRFALLFTYICTVICLRYIDASFAPVTSVHIVPVVSEVDN